MDEYRDQRAIVAALNAEIGARGWTRKQLAQRAGLAEQTIMRLFLCRRPMGINQLSAMIDALGVTMEHIVSEADRWSRSMPTGIRPTSDPYTARPTDPRALIEWLINNPKADETLNTRLSDVEGQTGLSGSALRSLRDEVVHTRKQELTEALRALPPSGGRASNHN